MGHRWEKTRILLAGKETDTKHAAPPPALPPVYASKEAWLNYARLLLSTDWTGRQAEYERAVEVAIGAVLAKGGTREEVFNKK
jgi:hypothetical protein